MKKKRLIQFMKYEDYIESPNGELIDGDEDVDSEYSDKYPSGGGVLRFPTEMGNTNSVPVEHENPFDYHNFHKCFTNFPITSYLIKRVASVSGVEIIQVTTRYSFLVAIARMFDERDVKEEIRVALNGETSEQ